MLVNLDNIVSISDANRNFSQVARKVDQEGTVVIMKNNRPRYVVMAYSNPQAGGISMRKLHYKRLSVDRPQQYYELQVVQGTQGIRLEAPGLTDKRAARQTQLFQGYVTLYAAKRLGLKEARRLLRDEGDPIALEALELPKEEDAQALLAVWFSQALLADTDRQRVMALYNAYGALPNGYAGIADTVRSSLGQQQADALLATVAAERYDEGDLADKAGERPEPNYAGIDFDAHLTNLVKAIG